MKTLIKKLGVSLPEDPNQLVGTIIHLHEPENLQAILESIPETERRATILQEYSKKKVELAEYFKDHGVSIFQLDTKGPEIYAQMTRSQIDEIEKHPYVSKITTNKKVQL